MKSIIAIALLSLCSMQTSAQETTQKATQETTTDAPKHLDFFGVSIEGNIDDFSKKMQPRFTLKKKNGGEQNFIFEGPIFGHNVYLQAYYTRKSRTPYRVVVSPKHLDLLAWQDSLVSKYGDPQATEQGLLWQRPEGIILYYTPEGYDTALIYLDNLGNAVFREEK